MSYLRRDFLKATGMLGLGALMAGCKNASIARTVIDAGVPENKGMGSNLRPWARFPEKTDLMMIADRPPLLETPLHFFLQDLTPNEAYFVRWHYAGLPTRIDLKTFRT
jgi:sulfite dehydrogenase (cytochrome) subunit A